jgi:hypothetical protein
LAKQFDEVVVFVKQQHGPLLFPPILHVVENLIDVKVFALSCATIPTRLKNDYDLISNMLQLDSKQKTVKMYNTQQLMLIKRVQLF